MINGKYMITGGAGVGHDDFGLAADEMIALCGKEDPSFLFVGFAQLEPFHGFEYYGMLFAKKGCCCSLLTSGDLENISLARSKTEAADIIFIMGGNTGKLMRTLRGYGVDEMLRKAAARGAVMSGFSAGAICLCAGGASKNDDYLPETGLGCVDMFCCPHPMDDPERFEYFKRELKRLDGMKGIACDGAALEIRGDEFRSFVFCPDGHMNELCKYKNGAFVSEKISEEWQPTDKLFS